DGAQDARPLATSGRLHDAARAVSRVQRPDGKRQRAPAKCREGRQGSTMESTMGLIERLSADLISARGALRTLRMTTHIARNPTRTFPRVVDELAARYGDAPALLSDRERFSYRDLAERSNRYARWALAQGLVKGDTICLMMPNRPEFLAFWLGVTRIGGVVALLNTNLTGPALAHCI